MPIRRGMVIALVASVVLASGASLSARELSQGKMLVSAGGGFSNDYFSIGASFGYFVFDGILPGVKYFYTHQNGSFAGVDYSIDQHDANLFLKWFIIDSGTVMPFIMVDTGYLHYYQYGDQISSHNYDLWSLAGGGGVLVFLTDYFAVEAAAGIRHYLSAPEELLDSDFNQTPFEWTISFGLYL